MGSNTDVPEFRGVELRNASSPTRTITERVYAKAVLSYQLRMAMAEALAQLACLRKRRQVIRSTRPDGSIVFQKETPVVSSP